MPASFDVIVIGTGVSGAVVAKRCRKAGWTVAIVDERPFGGTCALRGCDPKEVLIGGADVVAWHRRMLGRGVVGDAAISWPELAAFKRSFTDSVPDDVARGFQALGIETLHGKAHFTRPDALVVGDRELTARHVVIASGAVPRPLGIPGEELVASSTTFLELSALPSRIAFIGAGYVSLEFAHLAACAGARVAIFGRGKPLRQFDETVVDRLLRHTEDSGITVQLGGAVTAVEKSPAGLRLHAEGRRPTDDAFDLVVHGAGRVPDTAGLALDRAGVETDARGGVAVNEHLQSVSNARVYAVGDATVLPDKRPLTPVATHEGEIVASNLLHGHTKQPLYRGTPSVVFTIPPLAGVGLTEAAARAAGMDVQIKSGDTTDWYTNRRVRQRVGMFKTIIDRATDHVVGAHLLGEHAEEVINLFALAVRLGIPSRELKQAIYSYPTGASDLPYMI